MQLLVWLALIAIIAIIRALPAVFRFFCQYFLAGFFTPSGHRKFGDCEEAAGYDSLRREGFSDIEPRWASDAIGKIAKG